MAPMAGTQHRPNGTRVRTVVPGGPASDAGLRRGDLVTQVDGVAVAHELDFAFLTAVPGATLRFFRRGAPRSCSLDPDRLGPPGVELVQAPVRRCRNRCVFCFVDQMPPGLRRSLYVKDEDIRHSFLYGNFVTLSTMAPADLETVTRMRLSPLYVSVHATDTAVRNRLLGNPSAPSIRAQLRALQCRGIQFHTQIVVCPGLNDGPVLRRTLHDLLALRPGTLSVGIVPVGLTRFRRVPLRPVGRPQAREILAIAAQVSRTGTGTRGGPAVFCADELFLRAEHAIPPARYYAGYPQYENGIGMVRSTLSEWQALCRGVPRRVPPRRAPRGRAFIMTSVLAHDTLQRVVRSMRAHGASAEPHVVAVRNRFFGETVTVAGLLSARDVVYAARGMGAGARDTVVVPAVMFNSHGHTLDGFSAERLGRTLGVRVHVADGMAELAGVLGIRPARRTA